MYLYYIVFHLILPDKDSCEINMAVVSSYVQSCTPLKHRYRFILAIQIVKNLLSITRSLKYDRVAVIL